MAIFYQVNIRQRIQDQVRQTECDESEMKKFIKGKDYLNYFSNEKDARIWCINQLRQESNDINAQIEFHQWYLLYHE